MATPYLPDEIFAKILEHLHPDDILRSVSPACQRLHLVATDPLLWRKICISHFRAFSPEHRFEDLLRLPTRDVDWLGLYRGRRRRNAHASKILHDMTKSPILQLDKMEILVEYEYDIKEFLIEQMQSDPCQADGFCKAFWAGQALGCIHRRRAVEVWMENRDPARGPEDFCRASPKNARRAHERGHAAFDMFVLHDSWSDVDWITSQLDNMAQSLRAAVPSFEDLSTREQALSVVIWLRKIGFTGVQNHSNYRNLRNCFIGQAIRNPEHETIPITSATIYCAIASRVGITADPWFSPGHVIVCVRPKPDQTLDGDEVQEGETAPPMYLDPWGRDGEVPSDQVLPFMVPVTWYSRGRDTRTHPVETVLRVHNNIQATNETAGRGLAQFDESTGQLLSGHGKMNLLAAQYASVWASMILADPHEFAFGNVLPSDKLIDLILDNFPEDVVWIEQYLAPMLKSSPELFPANWKQDLDRAVSFLRSKNIDEESGENEQFWDTELASGQVFRHKRNDYIGLIFRAKMMPDTLITTGKADFFECQFADRPGEDFVVALGNIEIITDSNLVSPAMFPRAGQYFKRFDKETCRFIPIQEAE